MFDLYNIYRKKLSKQRYSPHPSNWLISQADLLSGELALKLCADFQHKFPKIIINGIQITDKRCLIRNARKYKNKSEGVFYADIGTAKKYVKNISVYKNIERLIQTEMKMFDRYQTEVVTDIGKIDCLSDTEIVEIKSIKQWKHGLGQLLAYATFYPSHSKCLYLFLDSENVEQQNIINLICTQYDVIVKYKIIN